MSTSMAASRRLTTNGGDSTGRTDDPRRSLAALDVGPPEGVSTVQHIINCTPGIRES